MKWHSYWSLGAIWLTSFAASVSAVTYNITPSDNWISIFNNPDYLSPGDELVLGAGTYTASPSLHMGYRGTAENPITVRAAEGASVVITYPTPSQNVLNIEGAQYLTIKGLEITGGSIGVRIREKNGFEAKYITLDGNYIHNTGNGAITANNDNQTYEGLHFLNNEIHDTGAVGDAAFYLGCNNLGCVFCDGIVEHNYIHDIDGDPGVGDAIQIKNGSYNNIIRDNVIHKTGPGGAVGILVYGTEGNAPNIIERNVIWEAGDNGIQAASDAIIRNNIVFSAALHGIRSQNHQGAVVGNLTIVNNTVISDHTPASNLVPLSISPTGAMSGPIVVANNAFYATGGGQGIRVPGYGDVTVVGNVGMGSSSPTLSTAAWDPTGNILTDFGNIAMMDAFPVAGSKLIGAGDPSYQPFDDFNTSVRGTSADVGAYVYDAAGNPGWQIVPGFKELLAASLDGDFDGDQDVDGADFLTWQRGFGNPYDAGNLLDWKTNYGTALGPLTDLGAVPEPSSIGMLIMCSAMLLLRRSPVNPAQAGT